MSKLEDVISLCKRRGFVFQSGEIYGGLQGVYDYGPLGVELKNNIKAAWWKANVHDRDDVVGLDSSILTHKAVLQHSGHEDTFCDLMVDCRDCKRRYRNDQLNCWMCECGSENLTEARPFNMLFQTNFGPLFNADSYAYLRPETAQGIFTNFKNILSSSPMKLPFGIAQIGKAFRNEITPRNFIFRMREFEQLELEYFCLPTEAIGHHTLWVARRHKWWMQQGLHPDNLKLVNQEASDLAHYAIKTVDILYNFPDLGFQEIEGIANRGDYDLKAHGMTYQNQPTKEQITPYCIEPSAGLDRGFLAILCEAYTQETLEDGKSRIVLKIKPHLAPIKVAVIPLARNNEQLVKAAGLVKRQLQSLGLGRIAYEDSGNIGKCYRKHDEIGTPLCIVIDFETLDGKEECKACIGTVSIRYRDTMHQERVHMEDLSDWVRLYYA